MFRRNSPLSNYYKKDENSGCWIWQGAVGAKGYGTYKFQGSIIGAHKAVYLTHHNITNIGDKVLDHTCKNKLCVNPEHLDAVTQAVNVQRGSIAFLNEWKVAKIREKLPYRSMASLAREFGVHPSTISDIKYQRSWIGVY